MKRYRPLVVFTLVLAGCRPVGSEDSRAAEPTGPASKQPTSTTQTKPGNKSMGSKLSTSGYDVTPLPRDQVAKLAARLSPEAYKVTQNAGTEPAFCGNLVDNKKDGVYCCVVCGLPLFSSTAKFHSGTGWPSFFKEFDPAHVARKTDRSHGMARTEINCARCTAHLGHVFDDGPKPTGERHCLNSASLKFYEKGAALPPESMPAKDAAAAPVAAAKTETAYFAGGCFWGVEHYFQKGPGVIDAASGYMQGKVDHPTYQQVCTDETGHAESVKVVFDPSKITYRRLLEAFFTMIDPTELNYQGPDHGTQYRSGIWTTSESQKREAEAYIKELTTQKKFGGRKIVTAVEPAQRFWPAEDYHQDYLVKTGRACHVKNPW